MSGAGLTHFDDIGSALYTLLQVLTLSDHAGFGFDVEVGSGWSEVMHQVRGCCLPTGVGHGRHRKQAACFEVEFVVGVSVVVFDAKSNTTKRIAGTMGTAVRSPIAGTMGTAVQCAMRCPVLVQAAFLVLRYRHDDSCKTPTAQPYQVPVRAYARAMPGPVLRQRMVCYLPTICHAMSGTDTAHGVL
eukprot:832319-Rhodomonas_salina.4